MPRAGQTGHHAFNDPGPARLDADWYPVTVSQDPEQSLALIFTQLGRDYGGRLPADFVPPAARPKAKGARLTSEHAVSRC